MSLILSVTMLNCLLRGREDIIDNAVALCPNCHRKMHSLSLKSDIKKLFTKIEKRN